MGWESRNEAGGKKAMMEHPLKVTESCAGRVRGVGKDGAAQRTQQVERLFRPLAMQIPYLWRYVCECGLSLKVVVFLSSALYEGYKLGKLAFWTCSLDR